MNKPNRPAPSAETPEQQKEKESEKKPPLRERVLQALYDFFEVLATVTVTVMLLYAFGCRLQIVDGTSMLKTLHDGERLVVSDLGYEPRRGDIVIIHRIDAAPYSQPIVKRVIALPGQTVDIDFDTWTLTVDGEVIEEPYRWLDLSRETLGCEYPLPITLGEHEIFVMGDNRNGSADSRQEELGPVDIRTAVGHALMRVWPRSTFTVFENPFGEGSK